MIDELVISKAVINIRDPKRIYNFTNELARIWATYYPDWRFGQLCSNFFSWLDSTKKIDLFFPEEDQIITYLREYCGEVKNARSN